MGEGARRRDECVRQRIVARIERGQNYDTAKDDWWNYLALHRHRTQIVVKERFLAIAARERSAVIRPEAECS